jgi:hypothetical protein
MNLRTLLLSLILLLFSHTVKSIEITQSVGAEPFPGLEDSYEDPSLHISLGITHFKANSGSTLTATYTISNPGHYVLNETINSSVKAPSTCILYINSSDVTLNLSGHALIQDNLTSSIDGILINNSLENILIYNGTIRNTTENGIAIGNSCTNIHLEKLFISNCDEAGINFEGTNGNKITNSSVFNCTVTNCNGGTTADAIGLKVNYTDFLTIKDSQSNSNTTTTDTYDGYGVYITNSDNCTFINTVASGNKGETIGAGFYANTCTNLYFKNCTAALNTSTDTSSGQTYGFYLNSSDYSRLENCIANRNTGAHEVSGFSLISSAGCYVNNCSANNQETTGNSATNFCAGFYINSDCNTVINSTALSNKGGTSSSSSTYGFFVTNKDRVIIENCYALCNGQTVSNGYGIFMDSNCTNCIVKNSVAIGNHSSTTSQGVGIGDDHADPSTNLIIDCFGFNPTTGTNKNYDTNYTFTNNVTEVDQDNMAGITIPTHKNISIND